MGHLRRILARICTRPTQQGERKETVPTLNEDGFCIEKSFVPVKRCEEEGSVAGRVCQQAEVMLLYVEQVLGNRE